MLASDSPKRTHDDDAMDTTTTTTTTAAPEQQDLVEEEPPQAQPQDEDEDEDEAHAKGTWILFLRQGEKRIAKVLEDKCKFEEKEDGTKKWFIKVHTYENGKVVSLVQVARKRIVCALKMDGEGKPVVPADTSESEGEEEAETEEEAEAAPAKPKKAAQKKRKKAGDGPSSPIEKKAPKAASKAASKAPKKSKKVEVDHEEACKEARVWAIQQLALHKFKDADVLGAMATPGLVPEGTDDAQLKGYKKSVWCKDGITFKGCVMGYASTVSSNGPGFNLFASLLILMLTTKNADWYSDLKSLKKYIKDEAWYNVQGHINDDILGLDFTNKDQLQYVKSLYRCLNTHLSPTLAKFAPDTEVTQEMRAALEEAEMD